MRLLLTFALAMVGLNAQDDDIIQPPESGKFFYVDFPRHETHGMHAIKIKIPFEDG